MNLKFFSIDEFKCPCCGEVHMDEKFCINLDMAREIAGIPFIITSGYRCVKHNREVGGKRNSSHIKGLAVDIRCVSSTNRFKILTALLQVGFTRIGIGKDFIHVDSDMGKPDKVIWGYYL